MVIKSPSSRLLSKWMEDASFVFYGSIKGVGESNLEGVPADNHMVTMKIEGVIVAPSDLGDLTGKIVTVYLQSVKDIRKGRQITLFAKSWHYGKYIGVIGVGITDAGINEVRHRVINERLRQLDADLEKRIRSAMVIVSGRVISTSPVDHPAGLPGLEEFVEWWEAEMWIKTVEKGRIGSDLRIFYPVGDEHPWGLPPRCYPGQEGVWLLRPVSQLNRKIEKSSRTNRGDNKRNVKERLMAHNRQDYHAMSALQRIQSMIWRIGKE